MPPVIVNILLIMFGMSLGAFFVNEHWLRVFKSYVDQSNTLRYQIKEELRKAQEKSSN